MTSDLIEKVYEDTLKISIRMGLIGYIIGFAMGGLTAWFLLK
jgi:hypothetical protein